MNLPNWKETAKYYRRQLQVANGERCELCEVELPQSSEFSLCEPCIGILNGALNEPASRVLQQSAPATAQSEEL